jgi:hypothetical protein
LLYATDDCANFLAEKLNEPVLSRKEKKIIGWSDDNRVLYYFLGCSLLRLLKLLSNDNYDNDENKHIVLNLMTNIKYVLRATDPSLIRACILAILSLPNLHTKARERALKLLRIRDPTDFERFKVFIEEFLKDQKQISYLLALADLDSSISGSLISSEEASKKS